MPAGKYDFVIEQGATWDQTITWYLDDTQTDVVDLTNYTAAMTIKDSIGGTARLELTSAAGELVLGGAAGTIQILVTSAVTALLDFDKGVYDLELTNAAGSVTRLLEGQAILSKEVTT